MTGILKKFFDLQWRLSERTDESLFHDYRVDGQRDFVSNLAPLYIKPGSLIYDIGGGKRPFLDPETKSRMNIKVTGLDLAGSELAKAPEGAYDQVIEADITTFQGIQDADIVICQALLEHVKDSEAAIKAMTSILKPGGLMIIFVPSSNAIYSKINILLPEGLKGKLLDFFYKDSREIRGFISYYDRCTPDHFLNFAEKCGLEPVEERLYFISRYLFFFYPAYLLWRARFAIRKKLLGERAAAETFTMVLRKI